MNRVFVIATAPTEEEIQMHGVEHQVGQTGSTTSLPACHDAPPPPYSEFDPMNEPVVPADNVMPSDGRPTPSRRPMTRYANNRYTSFTSVLDGGRPAAITNEMIDQLPSVPRGIIDTSSDIDSVGGGAEQRQQRQMTNAM